MSKKDKNKIKFEEGPFGVGATVEEIENLNVYKTLLSSQQFDTIIKDLDDEQTEHVLKEAQVHADAYQKVLDKFTEILSTPEGKKKFQEMALKKMSGR